MLNTDTVSDRTAKIQLAAALQEKQRRISENKLLHYKPYKKQMKFHELGSTIRERLFMAGNQLGKCTLYDTEIDTPDGVKKVCELQHGDFVMAWNGSSKVPKAIYEPFQKDGEHECAMILMSDGRVIEVADHHRVLVSDEWPLLSECLPQSFFCHLPSNLECDQSIHVLNALSFLKTIEGYQDDCLTGLRQCDEPLQEVLTIAQVSAPLLADALQRICRILHLGDAVHRQTDSLLSELRHPSSRDVGRRFLARFAAFLYLYACKLSESNLRTHQELEPLYDAASSLLQSVGAVVLQESFVCHGKIEPLCTPNVDGTHIIAVIPIGRHKVYDFTVPDLHNYCAGGLVHHNTIAGAAEMAMHLTGLYPEWWQGRRYKRPVVAWASGITGETVRDTVQRLLVGRTGEYGTGFIPKHCIIGDPKRAMGTPDLLDSVQVRHVSGGISRCGFKSYATGREKWQGETLDILWLDEEPPQDIYTEGLTRTNATGGFVYMTFTPLLGMSEVVRRFISEQNNDRVVVNMTIDDVDHYTEEQKASIIASYPAHEREARAKGVPTLGSGRIFPISEESIKCEPFQPPAWWCRIGGLDFGWDHPTAAVKIIWDRDDDVIYVTSCHKLRESTPIVHAAAIKPWGGDWMPWAWPHDGLQHDKGSGDNLADQYRKQGLRMTAERATFPDGTNGVEAGLMEMLDRMQTGRLKVFSHLNDWFDEFRLYHRKDGKVVKEYDDLLSATRYAIMMKRYAQQVPRPREIGNPNFKRQSDYQGY